MDGKLAYSRFFVEILSRTLYVDSTSTLYLSSLDRRVGLCNTYQLSRPPYNVILKPLTVLIGTPLNKNMQAMYDLPQAIQIACIAHM